MLHISWLMLLHARVEATTSPMAILSLVLMKQCLKEIENCFLCFSFKYSFIFPFSGIMSLSIWMFKYALTFKCLSGFRNRVRTEDNENFHVSSKLTYMPTVVELPWTMLQFDDISLLFLVVILLFHYILIMFDTFFTISPKLFRSFWLPWSLRVRTILESLT